MKSLMLGAALALAAIGGANAGTLFATVPNQPLFGTTTEMNIYRVATDLQPSGPQLEPEGMTWYNGTLYVTGDAGAVSAPIESNGYIAAYVGGNIGASPTPLGQFSTGGRAIGAEGITVNTRGSGYGSFTGSTPRFSVVDSAGGTVGRILAALDPTGPSVQDIQSSFLNSDDIAYVPGVSAATDRFAFIDGASSPPSIKWYSTDATPAALSGGFNLEDQAKGLLYLSKNDAQLFSSLANSDCLMVAVGPTGSQNFNKLRLYDLSGNLIASSALPTGTGPGLLGGVEDLAFDPVTRTLYLGDENGVNSQIAVLSVPEPASCVSLAVAAGLLALVVRRRSA